MKNMPRTFLTIKEAQKHWELDNIRDFEIIEDEYNEYWIFITGTNGFVSALYTARGEIRKFRSANSAIKSIKKISNNEECEAKITWG